MKNLCLYFQVHQPFRLRKYRFFDIWNDHNYYDDHLNESVLKRVAEKCYLPANQMMLDLLELHNGKFRVAFSITGLAVEQFRKYAPEVLDSFRKLAAHPCVEILGETYAHSLASLDHEDEFVRQVKAHESLMKEEFDVTPQIFRNTELIYSDSIGAKVAGLGYKGMLTEGAKHILGWKSPDFLYCNNINPRLKVFMKNFKLSDDIAFRFSNKNWEEWPLTADKYAGWLQELPAKEEVVGIFMDYETFGEHQWADSGIFEFMKALPGAILKQGDFQFATPSEVVKKLQPVSEVSVPWAISWADEEKDLSAWLGNPLQNEAYQKLYGLKEKVEQIDDSAIQRDWYYLQASDHFYYMCTKFFSDGEVHSYFTPYDSPYDAFINYMNVLSDFELRVNSLYSNIKPDPEQVRMTKLLKEKEALIARYEKDLKRLRATIERSRKTESTKSMSKTKKTTKSTKIQKKSSGKSNSSTK